MTRSLHFIPSRLCKQWVVAAGSANGFRQRHLFLFSVSNCRVNYLKTVSIHLSSQELCRTFLESEDAATIAQQILLD